MRVFVCLLVIALAVAQPVVTPAPVAAPAVTPVAAPAVTPVATTPAVVTPAAPVTPVATTPVVHAPLVERPYAIPAVTAGVEPIVAPPPAVASATSPLPTTPIVRPQPIREHQYPILQNRPYMPIPPATAGVEPNIAANIPPATPAPAPAAAAPPQQPIAAPPIAATGAHLPARMPGAAVAASPSEAEVHMGKFDLQQLMGPWFTIGHAKTPSQIEHFKKCACDTIAFFLPQNYTSIGRRGGKRINELVAAMECFNKIENKPRLLFSRYRLLPNSNHFDVLYTRNIPGVPEAATLDTKEKREEVQLVALVDNASYAIFHTPATGNIWILARDLNLAAGMFDRLVDILLKALPTLSKDMIVQVIPNKEECKTLYSRFSGGGREPAMSGRGGVSALPLRNLPGNVPSSLPSGEVKPAGTFMPSTGMTDDSNGVEEQYPADSDGVEYDSEGMSIDSRADLADDSEGQNYGPVNSCQDFDRYCRRCSVCTSGQWIQGMGCGQACRTCGMRVQAGC